MTTPRNLVLLLSSGHTVRITLRDDDLTTSLDQSSEIGVPELDSFLELPAVLLKPDTLSPRRNVTFAYIEDPTLPQFREGSSDLMPPSDFQRISVEGPGTVVQYG